MNYFLQGRREPLKIALENKELERFNEENKSEINLAPRKKEGERDKLLQAVERKRLLARVHKSRYIFPTHRAAGWHSHRVHQSLQSKRR